jgi:diaminopimelate decarboxylase
MMTNEQLKQLAIEYGTPVYVYDTTTIKEQYQKLTTAFAAMPVSIFYACKALTNINILKFLHSIGSGIDCSSINEVKLALHAGVPKEKILYTSNGVAFEEIDEAAQLGVHINIDSISNVEKFAKKYKNTYPIGVRIRPNILAGGNLKISTGHERSKFGIPVNQVNEVLQLMKEHQLIVKALHIHTGSDIKDADVFIQGINVLSEIIPQFPDLKVIDLGGGFKVPYQPDHDETDVQHIANKLEVFFSNNKALKEKNFEIWFEPGKYLVSQAGYFITQVNVLKETSTITFAGVNSGLNHLIRPMFYDAYHHIENISNEAGEEKIYTVTGNICETDTFASDRKIAAIREGDFLVFYNAGAYCFEMSSNYNARYKPAELMWINGKAKMIRKPDNFEDLLAKQVDLNLEIT